MDIPKYKPSRRISWSEICDEFPDVADQIVREDQWSPFERKPDFTEVDKSLMQWVPEKVRER